jgi:flavin reductase (DIM6/NTAB) family NADH-FMN oxidoreductase RutF
MDTKALHRISYGLYVIGAAHAGKLNAQIANTVVQVCSEPPTISVCINKGNLTHEYIEKSGAFSAAVIAIDTPLSFIGRFGFKSGRDGNKLEGVTYRIGNTGSPIVTDNAVAYLEAKVISRCDVHTHTIFVGEITDAAVLKEGEPMTYAYYQQVKRGTTPKTAPSYVASK